MLDQAIGYAYSEGQIDTRRNPCPVTHSNSSPSRNLRFKFSFSLAQEAIADKSPNVAPAPCNLLWFQVKRGRFLSVLCSAALELF